MNYHINPKGISLTKRRRQVVNRLRVMLRYFEPSKKESYLGLLKNVVLLVTSVPLVQAFKRRLEHKRGWL